MLLDFDFRTCSRVCAATGRTLQAGEVYFSLLLARDAQFVREDYSAESWPGAPEECVGWWRAQIPTKQDTVPQLAPTEVMLNLFEALDDNPQEEQFRYILGLLLMRKKVLRREETALDDQGRQRIALQCPRRNERYELIVNEPDDQRAVQLQQRMVDLLYGDADANCSKPTDSSIKSSE